MAVNGAVSKLGKVRKTAIDARTMRHAGDVLSQRIRTRIEEGFAWVKKLGGLAKAKLPGSPSVTYTVFAFNLIQIPRLLPAQTN